MTDKPNDDKQPTPDPAEQNAFFPSPYSLSQFTSTTSDLEGADYPAPYRGGRWKILLIGADERYLPTDNGTLFSTGNHPVETLLPMYHLDKAGFAFDIATLSGNPVKFEWWAMPTEDEAVVGLYGKYQEQFRQPARLADLLVRALGPESDYLGVFIPGGHGALMGLPESREPLPATGSAPSPTSWMRRPRRSATCRATSPGALASGSRRWGSRSSTAASRGRCVGIAIC